MYYALCSPLPVPDNAKVNAIAVSFHKARDRSADPAIFAGNQHHSPRLPCAVFEYKLDATCAGLFGTDNVQFIYPRENAGGMGYLPVVRTKLFGPVVVCTKRNGYYEGISVKRELFIHVLSFIFDSSFNLMQAGHDTYPDEVEVPDDLEARIRAARP